MLSLIKRYYRSFCRALAFARIGWSNYDWDNGYLDQLVLFKLKRMQYEFLNHGYHWEGCKNYKPKMKSLALTIKLLEKLVKDDYTRFYNLHEKKWGARTYVFKKLELSNYSTMETTVALADTPEKVEQERKEFLEASSADDRQRVRDLELAYRLIGKYSHYWWD